MCNKPCSLKQKLQVDREQRYRAKDSVFRGMGLQLSGEHMGSMHNQYLELEMTEDMPQKNMAIMGIPIITMAPPP